MEQSRQRDIRTLAHNYRERLEATRKELSPEGDHRGIPLHPLGRRLLALEDRILDIENALLDDLEARAAAAGQRRIALLRTRARELTSTRLGTLRHYPPIPLTVPTRYLTSEPPGPAPTISIVTPSFGQGQYIERTLYSVINQNYPRLEYVVQDGGSTDDTVQILRRYAPALAGWASEPDDGQADALNRGFARTSGEIMAYLNSDDLLLPGSLAYVGSYFAAHPDVDVVYGHRVLIDFRDREVGRWVLPRHDDNELTLIDYVPQETLFWRRTAWEKAGGKMDASLHFAIDWDLLLRLRQSGARMVRVPRFLGAFRVHDEQKTTTWNDVGLIECDNLRQRVHGRPVSHDEASARTGWYLRRHVAQHLWEQLKLVLYGPRTVVRTLPLEPQFHETDRDGEQSRPSQGQGRKTRSVIE